MRNPAQNAMKEAGKKETGIVPLLEFACLPKGNHLEYTKPKTHICTHTNSFIFAFF